MPNVTIDSVQELSENSDNMNNSDDGEGPPTIIDETSPISRLSATRDSLSRPATTKKMSTCTKNKKKRAFYKKGSSVKIKRDDLCFTLKSDDQKEDGKSCGYIMNSYNEMKSGNGK